MSACVSLFVPSQPLFKRILPIYHPLSASPTKYSKHVISCGAPISKIPQSAKSTTHTENPRSLDLTASTSSETALQAIRDTYAQRNATLTRGTCSYELGRRAAEVLRESRQAVQKFIGARKPEEIVFLPTAFEGMRILANSYAQILGEKEQVILANTDDWCNTIWHSVSEQTPFRLLQVPTVSFSALAPLLSSKVRLIIMRNSSIFGNIHDLGDIIDLFRSVGVPMIVDVSDTLHYARELVNEYHVDFLVSHCTSIGANMAFLYGRAERLSRLPPAIGGDNALSRCFFGDNQVLNESNWGPVPDRFEVGTALVPMIASLGAVAEQYNAFPPEHVDYSQLSDLAHYLYKQLNTCHGVQVYGESENRAPLACFNVSKVEAIVVAGELFKRGVIVTVGCHGSRNAHEELGIKSSLRAQFRFPAQTRDDVNHFISTLKEVMASLQS